MRRAALACVSMSLLVAAPPAAAVPDFVPKPSGIYERYTALKEPRSELPVGALWIDGFGPHGEAASADNLATIKSLTGVAINRQLQLSLTAGILSLFGIDPSYRSQVAARFADLTIVQVKDPAKLSGPPSEPRIVEALKAGTITITTDSDVGLDFQKTGQYSLPGAIVGRADTGRKKSWTIDGRDLFIAFRVATLKTVRGEEQELRLEEAVGGAEAVLDDHRVLMKIGGPAPSAVGTPCAVQTAKVAVIKAEAPAPHDAQNWVALDPAADATVLLPLSVPKADGKGGLFTGVRVRGRLDRVVTGAGDEAVPCTYRLTSKSRVIASYEGSRLETLGEPRAPDW